MDAEAALEDCVSALSALPDTGVGAYARVIAALDVLIGLDRIYRNPDEEPFAQLAAVMARAKAIAQTAAALAEHLASMAAPARGPEPEPVAELYARAWTTYSDNTYDHSVSLVEQRLRRSGFDEKYFRDKTCFDGGCGTGRLSVAMAKAGARRVVAVDVSEQSLEYLRRTIERYRLRNIELVRQDVTDLGGFEGGSFDFVASNGVLHHTPMPERGIIEHFRVTRPGGIFWLYLYGAGGLYWQVYDRFRPVVTALPLEENYRILRELRTREGLIYTFLDNFRAPRVYFLVEDVLSTLRRQGDFEWRHAAGMSAIDDTKMLLSTKWGPTVLGPHGEVRIVVTKR